MHSVFVVVTDTTNVEIFVFCICVEGIMDNFAVEIAVWIESSNNLGTFITLVATYVEVKYSVVVEQGWKMREPSMSGAR